MKPFDLKEYLKDPSRKVVTRDGRNVRIICTDFNNFDFPVIGEIKGYKWPLSFATNGETVKGRQLFCDLFFAPEKHEGWVNVFKSISSGNYMGTFIFKSKEEAEEDVKDFSNCIATIKIEWED